MAAKSHPRDLGRPVISSISTIRRSAAAQGSHASKRPGSHRPVTCRLRGSGVRRHGCSGPTGRSNG
ncbi:hypothetical protein C7S15_6830 [Burkholderia cepacia]|nr:hypothetical protein [Burkholderia cepacia]